jgi:hypothetical protein
MTVNGEQEMSPLPDTFFSQVDEAKQRAARLAARNDALTNATKKRDDTLFALFRHLHALDNELRKLDPEEVLKELEGRYGTKPTKDSARVLVSLAFPDFDARTRTKYAATLRYIRQKKRPNQKMRTFVRENGGINGCVQAEKKLRTAFENGGRGNPPRKRPRSQ